MSPARPFRASTVLGGAAVLAALGATCGPSPAGGREQAAEAVKAADAAAARAGSTVLRVEAEPFLRGVPRLGVNLGTWTSWGAEQLPANVVKNPGFEGLVDRAIVVVRDASPTRFTDDDAGLGRADGFWDGARFDVRTGAAAGTTGRISRSLKKGASGFPELEPEELVPGLAKGDVVALTRVDDASPPPNWWIPPDSARRVTGWNESRPGGPGKRCVALDARSGARADLLSYLDALGGEAGKMLPVRGAWLLSFWVRAETNPSRLKVSLRRGSQPEMATSTFIPGAEWKRVDLPFTAKDDGPFATLELHFEAGAGRVLVDDVELSPAGAAGPGAFREEVVAALKVLQPGILRDWQGQLGDTLENRVAPSFARRSSRYRTGEPDIHFQYGLPEFLDLCRATGAVPWVVGSPAFSDEEWRGLGRFLAGEAGRGFGEILVEFGNENWNVTFRPAGIMDPGAHREAIQRAARFLGEGSDGAPVRMVANGPQQDPAKAAAFAAGLPPSGLMAVAPYFFYRVKTGTTTDQRIDAMLADDDAGIGSLAKTFAGGGVELASAELNLHATYGDAPPEERDPLVTGAAAGTALARRALATLSLGMKRQCIFSLGGWATSLAERPGLVRLFGIARDLAGPPRLRPTGLAMALLNRALPGDAHRAGPAPPGITALAFGSGGAWSAALVSSRAVPASVEISFPSAGSLPSGALVLASEDPLAGNEAAETVRLAPARVEVRGRTVTVHLPPRSAAVLVPAGRVP